MSEAPVLAPTPPDRAPVDPARRVQQGPNAFDAEFADLDAWQPVRPGQGLPAEAQPVPEPEPLPTQPPIQPHPSEIPVGGGRKRHEAEPNAFDDVFEGFEDWEPIGHKDETPPGQGKVLEGELAPEPQTQPTPDQQAGKAQQTLDRGRSLRGGRHRRPWFHRDKKSPIPPKPPQPPKQQKPSKPPKPPKPPKAPKPPRYTEATVMDLADRVAKMSMKAEKGRFNPLAMWRLSRAEKKKEKAIRGAEHDTGGELSRAEKMQLAIDSDTEVERLRVEKYSKEKIGPLSTVAEFMTGKWATDRIAKLIQAHPNSRKLAALVVAAGVATALFKGKVSVASLGTSSVMGAALGYARRRQNERTVTARENTRNATGANAVRTRYDQLRTDRQNLLQGVDFNDANALSAYLGNSRGLRYGAVRNYRRESIKRERKAGLKGALIGAVAAPIAATGVVGLRHIGEGVANSIQNIDWSHIDFASGSKEAAWQPPAGVEAQAPGPKLYDEAGIRGLIGTNPAAINTIPGFENVHVSVVDEHVASQTYQGKTIWGSLQNGAHLSNGETQRAILDGLDKLHGRPGVHIEPQGGLKFVDGHYVTTNNQWSFKLSGSTALEDSHGDVQGFDLNPQGKAQYAKLFDSLRQGGKILDPSSQNPIDQQNMSGFISKHLPASPGAQVEAVQPITDAHADTIVDKFVDRVQELSPDNLAGAGEAFQQTINEYAAHASQFLELSPRQLLSYLSNSVSEQMRALYGWENAVPAAATWVTFEGIYARLIQAAEEQERKRRAGANP